MAFLAVQPAAAQRAEYSDDREERSFEEDDQESRNERDSQSSAERRDRDSDEQERGEASRSEREDRQSSKSRSNREEDQQTRSRGRQRIIQSARQMVEKHDENDDGQLQRSELPRNLRDFFGELDRDNNGSLSSSELREHARRMNRRVIPVEVVYIWVHDADYGNISIEDLQGAYETLRSIDRDGNGELSRSELRQRRQDVAKRWTETVMNRVDDDGNDQISWQEAEDTFLARRFDDVDKNQDDRISRNELKQCLVVASESRSEDDSPPSFPDSSASREDQRQRE